MAGKPQLNRIIQGDWVEVLKALPSNFVHCGITSPPYWGQRNYGVEGQLGLEATPEEHIENLVKGFREFRRVLRDDGCLWLNYGDKYVSEPAGNFGSGSKPANGGAYRSNVMDVSGSGLEQGNLLMLPARVALALQADGWYLRSDIIWAKALSFCPTYSGSTMPESVNGWRWERHKIRKWKEAGNDPNLRRDKQSGRNFGKPTIKLCPGCSKCEPTGGWVLRRGSWRPTSAHEHLFLLTKTDRYYCDAEAVREEGQDWGPRDRTNWKAKSIPGQSPHTGCENGDFSAGRNLRNVWCINPKPYKFAHYATFPPDLIIPCIKAGTSERGCCPKCGAPWARMMSDMETSARGYKHHEDPLAQGTRLTGIPTKGYKPATTLGWRPTCKCGIEETSPCLVYDPFMGSATVAAEAARLGRNYLGSELNKEYLEEQAKYRVAEAETGVTFEEQKAGQIPLFGDKQWT